MIYYNSIKKKILNKKLKVGVIGMGYVGFPLSIIVSKKFKVIGFDISKKRINFLKKNNLLKKNKNLTLSSQKNILKKCDFFVLCLPTPLKKNKDPDLSYVKNGFETIKPFLKNGQVISLESTSYPGTTREIISKNLEKLKFKIGKNFFVGFSSEREDPGNKKHKLEDIVKVYSGHTSKCINIMKMFYSLIFNSVHMAGSLEVAEMSKLLENIYRSVNIGLVNEMKKICTKMNIDIHDVIKAAETKNFGFNVFWPGPGMGGHCIPIDPFYLTWKAKEFGAKSRFIELAGEINSEMPHWVFNRVKEILDEKNISIFNSKILLLGVAYKKNIDDTRGSPAFKLIELMLKNNAKVSYNDNFIKNLKIKHKNFNSKSLNLTKKELSKFDLVLLVTDHDYYDRKFLINNSKLIFDTRFYFNKNEKVYKC